jgi:hypothetical protein
MNPSNFLLTLHPQFTAVPSPTLYKRQFSSMHGHCEDRQVCSRHGHCVDSQVCSRHGHCVDSQVCIGTDTVQSSLQYARTLCRQSSLQ